MSEIDLAPVYLVGGSDRPKVATAVQRLRRHFDDAAVERVGAQEAGGADVVALCNAGSLFGDRRLVVVDDVDGRPNAEGQLRGAWKAGDVEAIVDYLRSPAPDVVLAMVANVVKKDSPLAKACTAAGDVLAYDVAKRRVVGWVGERFRSHGVTADSDACQLLVQLVGEDLEALASEIEKIATWADGEPVGSVEVARLAAASAETPVYAITDAWGRRDVARALTAAETALERSARPPAATVSVIAAHVARQVGIVRRAHALDEEGVGPKDGMGRLGLRHDFQARRAYEFAANVGAEGLDAALVRVAELDRALKGASRLQPELELERALVEITVPPGRAEPR